MAGPGYVPLIEDLGAFGVWTYTQGSERRWAYALRIGEVYLTSLCVSNFATREDAIRAGETATATTARKA